LNIIREYPGQDEVYLTIATKEGTLNLEMPNITTNYCTELRQELLSLARGKLIVEEGDE
jgi:hypothetical protein